jgi:hypothetical protein
VVLFPKQARWRGPVPARSRHSSACVVSGRVYKEQVDLLWCCTSVVTAEEAETVTRTLLREMKRVKAPEVHLPTSPGRTVLRRTKIAQHSLALSSICRGALFGTRIL